MLFDPKWKVEPEVKVDAWRQILLDAVKVMDEQGWTTRALKDDRGYCSIGALRMAQYGSTRALISTRKYPHADYLKAQKMLRRVIDRRSIIKWNDSHETWFGMPSPNAKKKVRAAFIRASKMEE